MKLQDHIEYIRNRCLDAIGNNDKMSVASFESGEGLIMTFNEAIEIVNEIERLKAEQAELLEALKNIVLAIDVNNPNHIGYNTLEKYQIHKNYIAIAKAAIKNAEKTLPL
jgi:hypothetical protein